ncbi:MAG: NAD(P)/FAD-dependent oxidoreductase [Saprospiraceae bacterium]|nr:NAD(P)/FAD-dependent oxidoreductase [Saprospiraceae bacterium]MCF8249465.1 NAD(P)/FAD-dependent oxidoreductase [Saprospiraceae bacterium]MCF8311594.1 NAD(P)/FAD-dependent oxidoreductase [Saprospiraceae bacterium]MCF8440084.1 NAD(P)/FAD-dependent oxidoreductase [Saprospiraceae bacterium]
MQKTDILIIGAGPGGCATALKLSQLGIPSVVVDKAVFPRDKVCGDAISGKAVTILRRIDPGIVERFEAATAEQSSVWGIRFGAPNGKCIDVPFRPNYDPAIDPKQGFVSKRMDFDNRLVEEVKLRSDIELHEGISIEKYERTPDGYLVSNGDGSFQVQTKLLIVANGAHSAFSRHQVGLVKDEKHHAGAVRAYYKNVTGLHPDGFIELHFLKEINPGYFWVFGLPSGHANVGLGMRSDFVSKRRYNLTKGMLDIITNHPEFRERFKDAELMGKITGYGLPLGSKQRQLSGDNFMLVGDAGHLIDPLSGEGIGNAIYSGVIAAEQAQLCLSSNDFSAKTMHDYDVRVARVLGKEMEMSLRIQQLMARPWLVNFTANRVARNPNLIYLIAEMYADLEMRKKALNPLFWIKTLMKRA